MKTVTIRARDVVEHKGFIIGEGAEVYVDGCQGLPGDFVVVSNDGAFLAIIDKAELERSYNVLQPRGRKPKAPPAFASPEQQPARQVTVEELIAAKSGDDDLPHVGE